jgi:hypothetical protein
MFKNGEYLKIKEIEINPEAEFSYFVIYDVLSNTGEKIEVRKSLVEIKSVYDLWELFGAEYSGTFTNNKFEFDETSMDIISVLMNKSKYKNEYDEEIKILQDKVIHIFGPESAFKSG